MRIIVLEKYPSSDRGGQERSLVDVMRQLAQRGHRITLLYANSGDLLPQYEAFCDRVIPIHGFALSPRLKPAPHHFIQDAWTVRQWLGQWFTDNETPLVYINQFYDAPFAALLSWTMKLPLVCHLRLPAPATMDLQRRIAIGQVQQFISVSAANRQGWLSTVKAPIAVVHNGMIPAQFQRQQDHVELRQQWDIPVNHRVISYVGRLDRRKGLETLLKAFSQVLAVEPQSNLVIAGKPLLETANYRTELESLAQDLGIHDRVRFLGHVDNAASVFHLSDLAIVPSQWAEPCARSIIEAMLAGTPVLASRVGGNVELLEGELAAGLFTAKDPNNLAQTILTHLNWRQADPSFGARVQQSAIRRFNLADKITAIEQIMQKTVQTHESTGRSLIQPSHQVLDGRRPVGDHRPKVE
jgi:glycosyltransferase involved in cell wall biosynthesis